MIRNFLFHRVTPVRDLLWDPMDVALFDRCIKYISTHYQVALLEDLVKMPNIGSLKKYATIMFDDGYKDNIEYALPILEKYNCKASFYVVTDCINYNLPTWTHVLEYSFQNTNIQELNLDFDFLSDDLKIESLPTKEDRIAYVKILKPFLKKLPSEQRELVLNKIQSKCIDVVFPKLMMNWSDLLHLKNAGHVVGSHTKSHCMLGTMSDEKEIKTELLESGKEIEKQLGFFPSTISYPVGSFNETVKRISREVGYEVGLAVKQNVYNPNKEDVFEISRIELYNEPWWKTRMRISNSLEQIKTLIKYK